MSSVVECRGATNNGQSVGSVLHTAEKMSFECLLHTANVKAIFCKSTWVKNSSLGDGTSIGDGSTAIGLRRRIGGLRLAESMPGGGIKKFLGNEILFKQFEP
jgi:hypothetical protein